MKEELEFLKERIEHDIEKTGGIEGFNTCRYAPEIISGWIGDLIRIVEILENKRK